MTPAASVVVPTHQGEHRLPALLDQLARQDTDAPWELVVVVDGVTDGTPALLAEWSGRLPLTVVTNPVALGIGGALSSGFAAASGDYLIRCDDDLDVPASFVSDHLETQDDRRDRVVLGLTRDQFADTPYARSYGRPANERALRASYQQAPEFCWQHVAACFSVHRDALAATGGFDPRFAYGEDAELGYRLFRQGCEFVINPALEVGHRGPANSAAVRVPRAFVSGASRRLFDRVHPEARRPVTKASGAKARWWNAIVGALALSARTPGAFRRLGRLVDAVLPFMSGRLGWILVAWLVEGAGRAGARYGSLDLHAYRTQKDDEVAHERQMIRGTRVH